MAITTKKDLNLIFTTESGKEYRMTIPDYREGITDAEIKTAAAGIVADIHAFKNGEPKLKIFI